MLPWLWRKKITNSWILAAREVVKGDNWSGFPQGEEKLANYLPSTVLWFCFMNFLGFFFFCQNYFLMFLLTQLCSIVFNIHFYCINMALIQILAFYSHVVKECFNLLLFLCSSLSVCSFFPLNSFRAQQYPL